MYKDEIIEEVWENRKKFSEKHHHNIDSMVDELVAGQNKSNRDVVDRRALPNNHQGSRDFTQNKAAF